MKYRCKYDDDMEGTREEWICEIKSISYTYSCVEILIIARASSIRVLIGTSVLEQRETS